VVNSPPSDRSGTREERRQLLQPAKRILQQRRIVEVGAGIAERGVDLRQDRAAEAVLAAAEVDEHQLGVAGVAAQLRRERAARVSTGAKPRR